MMIATRALPDSTSSSAASSSAIIAAVIALRFSGRFSVIRAIVPPLSGTFSNIIA